MKPSENTQKLFEELDYRENDGIEVSLLWNRSDDSLSVYVSDTRNSESLDFPVHPSQARDASTAVATRQDSLHRGARSAQRSRLDEMG